MYEDLRLHELTFAEIGKIVDNLQQENIKLKRLVSELLPYMLNDMTQGLVIGMPPFDPDHCKNESILCLDCQWFEDATFWKKRVDAGEFQDYE